MDVASAVAVRSLATAAVVALIVALYRVPLALKPRHRKMMPLIALLVGVQSLCLYSAVARIPVGLALLAFNTYPLWTAAAVWAIYGHRPEPKVLIAMPCSLAMAASTTMVPGTRSARDPSAIAIPQTSTYVAGLTAVRNPPVSSPFGSTICPMTPPEGSTVATPGTSARRSAMAGGDPTALAWLRGLTM